MADSKPARAPRDDGNIQSVSMTIRLLEELAASPRPLGVTELAKALGEQKARVHRHLSTLRATGAVMQENAGDRYRLGWKVLQLGIAAANTVEVQVFARRHLGKLRDELDQTVILGIPARGDALVVDCEPSNAQVTTVVKKGVVFIANTSSLGRTMLAFASEDVQAFVLARPMTQYTEFSIVRPTALRRKLAQIRERFFDVAVNENIYGVAAISAPVFDQNNAIVAAIGVVGSPFVIRSHPDPVIVERLQTAAEALSADLQSSAWQQWRAQRATRA